VGHAAVIVDKVDARLTLHDAELRTLKEKDTNLFSSNARQDAELQGLKQKDAALTSINVRQDAELQGLKQKDAAHDQSLASLAATHRSDTADLSQRIDGIHFSLVCIVYKYNVHLRAHSLLCKNRGDSIR
jgi:hypothetical protein